MINTLLSYLAYIFIRIISLTYRYEIKGSEHKVNLRKNSQNYIYAVWHNNIIGTILSHVGQSHIVMVSKSGDGDLIARTLTLLGNQVARGSSSRGALRALGEMKRIMHEKNIPGAITIDGPRGPIHVAKKGILEVAKETGAAILPLASVPSSFWSFKNSWDNFRLPKPFSKIYLEILDPIFIEKEFSISDSSQTLKSLEQRLLAAEEKKSLEI